MSYVSTANRPNPTAALGAMGIPAGIAALLITGLAITYVPVPIPDNPIGENIDVVDLDPIVDPDPAPDTPTSSNQQVTQTTPDTVVTRPDTEFVFELPTSGPIGDLPGLGNGLGTEIGPVDFGIPDPTPTPTFDPVSAAPRGNPGNWITDNDYRPSWISREFSGVAGFTLEIDRQGRISDCTITRSTGHTALDDATCRLLRNRAEFSPAKDSSGAIVPGTYTSSVNWQIP